MMKLFVYEHCPFCVKARMIFGFKDRPFDLAIMMEGDSETPTKMVGKKVVPILQKEDGSYMAESMDITRYIDQQNSPHLLNRSVVHGIEEWNKKASPFIMKLVIPRFTEGDFKELATDHASLAFAERETKAFGVLKQLKTQSAEWLQALKPLMQELEGFIDQMKQPGPSDFVLYPSLRSLSVVSGFPFGPKTLAYMKATEQKTQVDLLFSRSL